MIGYNTTNMSERQYNEFTLGRKSSTDICMSPFGNNFLPFVESPWVDSLFYKNLQN